MNNEKYNIGCPGYIVQSPKFRLIIFRTSSFVYSSDVVYMWSERILKSAFLSQSVNAVAITQASASHPMMSNDSCGHPVRWLHAPRPSVLHNRQNSRLLQSFCETGILYPVHRHLCIRPSKDVLCTSFQSTGINPDTTDISWPLKNNPLVVSFRNRLLPGPHFNVCRKHTDGPHFVLRLWIQAS